MQRAQSQLGRLSPGLFPPPTKSPAQMLDFLNARTDMRRKAGEIYGAIVTQARRPAFYADLGVPDTPSGRYEMVVVHLVLVLERLRSVPAAGRRPAAAAGGSVHCRYGRFACARWAPATLPFPRRFGALLPGYMSAAWPTRRRWRRATGRHLAAVLREHTYADADAQFAPRLARYVRAAAAALAATDARQAAAGSFEFPASARLN